MLDLACKRDVNIVEFFSNSPMWWMCVQNSSQGGPPFVDGIDFDKNYNLFGKYLASVVKYANEHWGVKVAYIEPFNEPISLAWVIGPFLHQEGCNIGAHAQAQILCKLDSWLKSDGISVAITASDENKVPQAISVLEAFERFDDNPIALIAKVNVHGYDNLDPYRGPDRALLSSKVRDLKKKLWMSEYGDNDQTGMTMATSMMLDLTLLQPDAWIYWQPLDVVGWGLIDAECDKLEIHTVSRKYYVFAQFSRHLRQGCNIIDNSEPNTVVAYHTATHKLHIVTLTGALGGWLNYDLSVFSSVNGPVRRWDTTTNPTDGVPDRTYAYSDGIPMKGKTFWSYCYPNSVYSFDIDGVST
jgi:galactan endo-1,6-beta-galactosidase